MAYDFSRHWGWDFVPVVGTTNILAGMNNSQRDAVNANKDKLTDLMGKRPDYKIPQAEQDYLAMMKANTNSDMPGMSQMKDDINSSTAQGERNIQQSSNSVSGTLGATASLYGNQMKTMANLDIASQQYKQQQKQAYGQALQTQAEYQDKAWNWNTGQKYAETYNYLQSQIKQSQEDLAQQKQNEWNLAGSVLNMGSKAATAAA